MFVIHIKYSIRKYFSFFVLFLTTSYSLLAEELKVNNFITTRDSVSTEQIPSVSINDSTNYLLSADTIQIKDSVAFVLRPKKNLLKGFGEGVFVNTFVWAADRWLLGKDYYSKGWSTIKDNWEAGWLWDTDAFSTNFIDHPYHGNLYYTAAKTSGCTYWESLALSALGSLEWEVIAETDYPSPNDFFSTTFGGAALGEMTTRVADIILNKRKRGFNRVAREIVAFGLAPMKGLNRIMSGDTWDFSDTHYLYHDKSEIPYTFFVSSGARIADTKNSDSRSNFSVNLRIHYGNPGNVRHNKPYDYFFSNMTFNKMGTHVPLVSNFNINGRLHGWQLHEGDKWNSVLSINQDFSYYNNEQQERFDGDRKKLLSLSESAAMGPAFTTVSANSVHMITSNAVFMGGYTSDYYYRAYNMGSGFNVKAFNLFRLSDVLFFNLDASYHYLFTWKGYEDAQIKKLHKDGVGEPYNFNVRDGRKAGDKGYTVFFILNPRLDIKMFKNIYFSADYSLYTRNSVYKYHKNIKSYYSDLKLSLTYMIK